jgi:hypothetical protein
VVGPKLPKLKPLVKTRATARLVEQRSFRLSHALEEALFQHADVLSEGGMRQLGSGQSTYYGSTMISIELAKLGRFVHGAADETVSRAALLDAIDGSVRVRLRAMRMARAEAARRVHRRALGTALCEIRVSLRGGSVHIDVDLEVPLRVSSRSAG